jgi:hypothetical protein
MHVGIKLAGAVALGVGAVALASACTGGSKPGSGADAGPHAELTGGLLRTLVPSWRSGGLDVATQGVREVREGGAARGRFDGTRLLQAADAHRFGAPAIADPAADVAGDGTATFNEVRQVVRHFDADSNGMLERAEQRSFEQAVGIRWLPA